MFKLKHFTENMFVSLYYKIFVYDIRSYLTYTLISVINFHTLTKYNLYKTYSKTHLRHRSMFTYSVRALLEYLKVGQGKLKYFTISGLKQQ
jgi:hypothetical protein